MDSKEQSYHLLRDEADFSSQSGESETSTYAGASFYKKQSYRFQAVALASLLMNLLMVALCLVLVLRDPESHHSQTPKSLYAKLAEDMPKSWEKSTEYTGENQTEVDHLWGSLRADDGIVALDKEWAAAQGLPASTSPFPWDENKAIYLISAYHDIHCLSMLHLSLREFRDGKPQSHPWEHNNHCLDFLRNNIMCRADDTPLYSTASRVSENGIGQYRQCRDWSKLEDWVRENTACYRYGEFTVEDKLESQIERFRYCPDDSPYLPKIREYYGKGDDWFPAHDDFVDLA